jgi:hypothetical protein
VFLKFKILSYSLIFILGLEIVLFFNSWSWLSFSLLMILSAIQGKRLGGRWIFSILPTILVFSSTALLYLVTFNLERQIFIVLSAGMYYLSLLGAFRMKSAPTDQTAKGMLLAGSFTAIFFSYSAIYGFYLNFFVPVYLLILVYFLISLFLSLETLYFFQGDKRQIWIFSLILSFILSQLIWTMNFWPFGYLTTGVVALILYYVLWEIVRSYFSLILSKKRMVRHLVGTFILITLVLLASKWLPNF